MIWFLRAPRLSFAKRAIFAAWLAVIIGIAGMGLVSGSWSYAHSVEGTVGTTDLRVEFTAAYTNDAPGNTDPGYEKDVAECKAILSEGGDSVEIIIANAYPSYTCRFWIEITNVGSRPLGHETATIEAPSVLTVKEVPVEACGLLDAGGSEVESFSVHVEQEATQRHSYGFSIQKRFSEATQGTIGFWKNWDSHNTFSRAELEGWLSAILAESAWLEGDGSIDQMDEILDGAKGKGATQQSRFMAQYLALRLNERSELQCASQPRNVTEQDPSNVLQLADPSNAALYEIIQAIEALAGTPLSTAEFEALKAVCDAINSLYV